MIRPEEPVTTSSMTDSDHAPSLAVVIATRDRARMLEQTLASLAALRRPVDEVIVADSASLDPAVREVALRSGATVVRCERPGTCIARNAGLAAARHELVAFVDDDCLVDEDWSAALLAAFTGPSAPDFVTGAVRADAPPTKRATTATAVTESDVERRLTPAEDPKTFGHGANMAWRRAALLGIGGFDEAMGPGTRLRAAEDVDVWWRALAAGLTGLYAPGAVVVHRQWRTRRETVRAYHGYGVGTGALLVKRHRSDPSFSRGALVRAGIVEEGLAPVARAARQRYEMAVVAGVAMTAGIVRGMWRAWRRPVVDRRFGSL